MPDRERLRVLGELATMPLEELLEPLWCNRLATVRLRQ